MGDEPITPRVQAFIAGHVESVMALEVLLLLAADPRRRWTGAALARELRIDAAWAAAQLAAYEAHGLLGTSAAGVGAGAGGPEFWYQPRDAGLAETVNDLARAYADRRVTIIGLIFAKPADHLRSFADAFRMRKDKSDG